MKIEKLRVNHVEQPLGYQMDRPVLSWVVSESTGHNQKAARIVIARDEALLDIVYDTGEREELDSLAVPVEMELLPRTRYFWQVSVTAENGDFGSSSVSWFETGKREEEWSAFWIAAPFEEHPVLFKSFALPEDVQSARLYICGLGLYEAFLNGERIGDEYLSPGFSSYQKQIPYQTYDVTGALRKGDNELSVMLGNGWYRGRFGFGVTVDCLYGDRLCLIAELRITHKDGTETVIGTDTDWNCAKSPVLDSNIYDGESYDASRSLIREKSAVRVPAPRGRLTERNSVPVRVGQRFTEYELIRTPKDELVLDFGQNMSGWVSFTSRLPKGRSVCLQYGELLQGGCFYRENLRTAKQEYHYKSDGQPQVVRPRFTCYGFRLVKIEGMSEEEIREAGFTAEAVWSDLMLTGTIETSDHKVNRLILNSLWGQRSNFVDIPTDCPQRDERMGWTGDAQAFSRTACYHMYTPAFYNKFMSEMLAEQEELDGSVPFVVPNVLARINERIGQIPTEENPFSKKHGSSAWGDAATLIPWNVYTFYGDKALLEKHYSNMKLWVEYIRKQDNGSHLWKSGFHFGDWLALDGPKPGSCLGGTDPFYVATCYYYLSVRLTAQAARVLGKTKEAFAYEELAEQIREAFRGEYFTAEGSLQVTTQTAYVLALNLELTPEEHREKLVSQLCAKIEGNGGSLDTGFVGTYQLCPALTKSGRTDLAYQLFLREDYPSWLYAVNLGATTIWERWDSLLEDGTVSGSGMNSMNHYAYGSIVQWVYETVAGLKPIEPGFRKALIAPEPTRRLQYVDCTYDSAAGRYETGWEWVGDKIHIRVTVPFHTEAELILPNSGRKVRLGPGFHEYID